MFGDKHSIRTYLSPSSYVAIKSTKFRDAGASENLCQLVKRILDRPKLVLPATNMEESWFEEKKLLEKKTF